MTTTTSAVSPSNAPATAPTPSSTPSPKRGKFREWTTHHVFAIQWISAGIFFAATLISLFAARGYAVDTVHSTNNPLGANLVYTVWPNTAGTILVVTNLLFGLIIVVPAVVQARTGWWRIVALVPIVFGFGAILPSALRASAETFKQLPEGLSGAVAIIGGIAMLMNAVLLVVLGHVPPKDIERKQAQKAIARLEGQLNDANERAEQAKAHQVETKRVFDEATTAIDEARTKLRTASLEFSEAEADEKVSSKAKAVKTAEDNERNARNAVEETERVIAAIQASLSRVTDVDIKAATEAELQNANNHLAVQQSALRATATATAAANDARTRSRATQTLNTKRKNRDAAQTAEIDAREKLTAAKLELDKAEAAENAAGGLVSTRESELVTAQETLSNIKSVSWRDMIWVQVASLIAIYIIVHVLYQGYYAWVVIEGI